MILAQFVVGWVPISRLLCLSRIPGPPNSTCPSSITLQLGSAPGKLLSRCTNNRVLRYKYRVKLRFGTNSCRTHPASRSWITSFADGGSSEEGAPNSTCPFSVPLSLTCPSSLGSPLHEVRRPHWIPRLRGTVPSGGIGLADARCGHTSFP